ncbi:contractile injection system protein, VgrG/Pvc8 family [Pragia fontium]|uniref:contractile injection system protein, VgrG/Pvc8 family n=1 Tax=Pragia fontium TaxID=82985 RepID=UPI000F71731B|nr:type VI secretion system Vgr family protein [Pragia fontium]
MGVKGEGETQRTVNGIVSQAFRGNSGFKRTHYTFIIRPELWLLTLTVGINLRMSYRY